jgi:hypothetical protein
MKYYPGLLYVRRKDNMRTICALPEHETEGGRRYPSHLQCPGSCPGGSPAAQDPLKGTGQAGRVICAQPLQACRLAGRQHSGRTDRFYFSGRSQATDPHS